MATAMNQTDLTPAQVADLINGKGDRNGYTADQLAGVFALDWSLKNGRTIGCGLYQLYCRGAAFDFDAALGVAYQLEKESKQLEATQ